MLKVLYDNQIFSLQRYGGISRCFVELYKHLPESCEAEISVRESNNIYVREFLSINPIGYQFNHFLCKSNFPGKRRLHLWIDALKKHKYYPDYNRNYSIELLKEGCYDVFHPTYFDDYFLPYLNGKPFVLTIHDMIPELFPQYFDRNDFQIIKKRKLAALANAIVVVSENTKRDVIRFLDIPEEKIHVVYHGSSLPSTGVVALYPFPYLLYIGGRKMYKNFVPFVKSMIPFLINHSDIRVVCVGSPFDCDELEFLKNNMVENKFISCMVNDCQLYSLYHHALCFVFPSEYEGFGIPILEAYQADCPVLLNQTSCLPEIAGDGAVYFFLNAEKSNLAKQLEYVFSMSSKDRNALLIKQRNRLARYSWETSAKQMAAIYQSCK
jgi:glycosyltransferase involved in cell wall biosynthesis